MQGIRAALQDVRRQVRHRTGVIRKEIADQLECATNTGTIAASR